MYQKMLKEQSSKIRKPAVDESESHPPRRGYTREVEVMHDVLDNIIAMRAEAGHWSPSSVTYSNRPLFPGEAARQRLRARARQRRDDAIAKAQARWTQQHDRAS